MSRKLAMIEEKTPVATQARAVSAMEIEGIVAGLLERENLWRSKWETTIETYSTLLRQEEDDHSKTRAVLAEALEELRRQGCDVAVQVLADRAGVQAP